MQNGSVVQRTRKKHSDIWQFRWREKTAEGKKIYRRRQIGTVDQIPDIEDCAESSKSSSARLECTNGKIETCFDDHRPAVQSF